jgi:hypothetical protein
VTTTFQRINEIADARKREKQAAHNALLRSTFQEDELITSQYSSDHHSVPVFTDVPYGDRGQSSLTTLMTEQQAISAAGGSKHVYDNEPQPLIATPDKYKDKRPCTCATHKGNRWQPLAEFSERKARNGRTYPCSWCKRCKADYAADMYYKSKLANGF